MIYQPRRGKWLSYEKETAIPVYFSDRTKLMLPVRTRIFVDGRRRWIDYVVNLPRSPLNFYRDDPYRFTGEGRDA